MLESARLSTSDRTSRFSGQRSLFTVSGLKQLATGREMAAYLVSIIRVLDWDKFRVFRANSPRNASRFGGEQLLRGRVVEMLEGPGSPEDETVAVIRF